MPSRGQGPEDTGSSNGASPEANGGGAPGAAGKTSLRPAAMLQNVLSVVPELRRLSNVDLQARGRLTCWLPPVVLVAWRRVCAQHPG